MKYKTSIELLLTELMDYFDDKADADHDGENYLPNDEMKFFERIKNTLELPDKGNSILINTMREIAVPYPNETNCIHAKKLCKYLIARAQEAINKYESL